MSVAMFHGPCGKCGSTDGCAVYDDGHTHCFVCESTTQAAEGSTVSAPVAPRADKDLIADVMPVPLGSRGLAKDTLAKFDYGVSKVNGRMVQVAQYHDEHGKVVAQKIRTPAKDFYWRGDRKKMLPLFGQHLWRATGKIVVVTEGELDALAMAQVQGLRWPVVSVPDGAGSAKKAVAAASEWLSGFEKVVLMFDQDAAGIEGAAEAAQALPPGKAHVARLPLKDACDMLKADRGKDLLDAMWGARLWRPDGVVTGEEMAEHMFKAIPAAVRLPFPELDAVLGGLRVREITTLAAGSGCGKSTLAREIAMSLADRGEKIGYVALEESVQRTTSDLVGARMNHNLRPVMYGDGGVESLRGDADVVEALEWVSDKFVLYNHFGSLDPDRLSSVMRHMIVVEGCRHLILDHISIVVSGTAGDDERKSVDRIMTKTRQLVEELGPSFILVSHLRRRSTSDKGYEEGAVPRLSDLRSSGSIEQLSDSVVVLARDMTARAGEKGQPAKVYVLKNRTMGTLGPAGVLLYNAETGRMEPGVAEEMFDETPKDHKDY